ncbi:hypothetical protein N657DRAFT_664693 [Parathielavia appendiculata]|uniref:Zn(2)-C6 fungal-type domain-containing protein n=1 Tax=Parathielavia appendiculata TaxID=2587402 RepID=A0AAN6TY19_9PEZI|nr:hypothetical protein N657DRAFT_664693 [Parathielavia appendiculata]
MSLDCCMAVSAVDGNSTQPQCMMAVLVAERLQCWECRRRRLVCDSTQPVCTKCQAARIVCPGYADKKPLTWLAPGQVMSRTRRKKNLKAPSSKTFAQKACNSNDIKSQAGPSATAGGLRGASIARSESQVNSDSQDIEVGRPVELRPEIVDVFEAILYYNGHIYPELAKCQLAPTGFIFPMPPPTGLPAAIVHTLVSIVISDRIIQVADDPTSGQLVKPMWSRLYSHRDIAIREIAKLVGNETTRKSIVTVVSVYTLFFAMLQQSFTPCWRTHIDAYLSLINVWGPFADVMRDIPGMKLGMMALFITSVLANTTSPRNDQLHLTSFPETLRIAETYYTEVYYPSISCPIPLFTVIIRINDLRTRHPTPSPETTLAATQLLARIESFSPETFTAAKKTFQPEWRLLSGMYHAAVALYAILSLESSGALPSSSTELDLARARHARRLFALLDEAVTVPAACRRMAWPLIVAGVEAARAGREVQRWVGERLAELSRYHGSATPRVAKMVLEGFWATGDERTWDQCFAEPVCLVC